MWVGFCHTVVADQLVYSDLTVAQVEERQIGFQQAVLVICSRKQQARFVNPTVRCISVIFDPGNDRYTDKKLETSACSFDDATHPGIVVVNHNAGYLDVYSNFPFREGVLPLTLHCTVTELNRYHREIRVVVRRGANHGNVCTADRHAVADLGECSRPMQVRP